MSGTAWPRRGTRSARASGWAGSVRPAWCSIACRRLPAPVRGRAVCAPASRCRRATRRICCRPCSRRSPASTTSGAAHQSRPLRGRFAAQQLHRRFLPRALATARALGCGASCRSPLPGQDAHVGWARRFAMDLALHRLAASRAPRPVILTTDADAWSRATGWRRTSPRSMPAPMRSAATSASTPTSWRLPAEVRRCVALDERYRRLVDPAARPLEPAAHDPAPGHAQHVGASLALTCRDLPADRRPAAFAEQRGSRLRAPGARGRRPGAAQSPGPGLDLRPLGRAGRGRHGRTLRAWAAAGPGGMFVAGLHDLLAPDGIDAPGHACRSPGRSRSSRPSSPPGRRWAGPRAPCRSAPARPTGSSARAAPARSSSTPRGTCQHPVSWT